MFPRLLLAAVCVALVACQRPAPTFSRDVAPIVFANCTSCHRPGQPVPFTLTKYEDARRRSADIVDAVTGKHMPPWLPERGGPAFAGERGLQDADIALIRRWAEAGAPEGNPADLPPAPSWPGEWELGTPDLVATMPAAYTLAPNPSGAGDRPRDAYRNVILPIKVPADRYVRAVEFRAEGAPVHHAVIRVDRGRVSRARDGADGQPGFDGMTSTDVEDPEGHFVGWAPGRGPIVVPDGMPWRLDAAADLVVELHLIPGKTPVAVRPRVGLYFTETPPAASPVLIVMGSKAIDIPAGEKAYAIEDSYELPVDATVLSVYPHAHYLGKEMTVRAMLPGGASETLIHIPRWSFHWQQDYRYVTPIALPRGTRITMRYTYDNSADNDDNPSVPPRRVTWGPQSSDEMGNLGIQLLPRSAADAAILVQSFAPHLAEIELGGARMLARLDPGNAAHHTGAGIALSRLGRYPEAIVSLRRAIEIDPQAAGAHNYLAGALLATGQPREALAHAERAARLSPGDAHLQFNHARMLASAGDSPGARVALDRALALNSGFAEAHQLMGAVLFEQGRTAAALDHLRRAAELQPRSASAHSDYGGVLAAAGRYAEAEVEIRRALEIDPANQAARQNLARLRR